MQSNGLMQTNRFGRLGYGQDTSQDVESERNRNSVHGQICHIQIHQIQKVL